MVIWTQSISWTHLRVDDNSVSIGRGLPAIASLGSRSLQGSPDVAKGGKKPQTKPILAGLMATQHWLVEVKWLMLEYFSQDTTPASVPAYDSFAME